MISSNDRIDPVILRSMETSSPAYRITTKSGIAIADGLPRSAPAIQLQEGTLSKGNKHPKDLSIGESSIVRYPLVEGSLVCRVTKTDGSFPIDTANEPIEFVEPDPVPKKEKRSAVTRALDAHYAAEQAKEEPTVKVRRGRGKQAQ